MSANNVSEETPAETTQGRDNTINIKGDEVSIKKTGVSQNELKVNDRAAANVQASKSTDEPKRKTTLEEIIESLATLDFLITTSTEVHVPATEDLRKMLSGFDEIILNEIEAFPTRYEVWEDVPNRQYYIIRSCSGNIHFSNLEELFGSLIELFEKRMQSASNYIREPGCVFLKNQRVYDPVALGLPINKLLIDSMAMDNYRARIEDVCAPLEVRPSYVRIKVLGDRGVILANSSLLDYAMNSMGRVRTLRERYLNQIALTVRGEMVTLNSRDGFEFYYPSFDFNMVQGPFDILKRSCRLRLLFLQAVVLPQILYTPISSVELMKAACTNATRTGFITDIAAREWKTEYSAMYNSFIMSYLCPGEILIDINFSGRQNSNIHLNGFAAVIARMVLMFNEKSMYCNTTADTQIAIDEAIIKWGMEMGAIVPCSAVSSSKFLLNNYILNKGSAEEQMNFNFLKIRNIDGNAEGGSCSNGNLYPKPSERLRDFYPDIAVRANYVVNCDDFQMYRNQSYSKYAWKVYLGAMSMLQRVPGSSGYRGLMQTIANRIFEFFIRLNEYNRVHWYNCFRMTRETSQRFSAEFMLKRSSRVEITPDFFLAVPKGFCNDEWHCRVTIYDKIRFESSFARESNRIAYLYSYVRTIFERAGALESFPSRRLITLACSRSELYDFIRKFLYYANEDRYLPTILSKFIDVHHALSMVYAPLLKIDNEFLHSYGLLSEVNVKCMLNYWNERLIKECMYSGNVLTNKVAFTVSTQYTYRDIELLLTSRSFNATFIKSSETPFKLEIIFPYKIVFDVNTLGNSSCLARNSNSTNNDVSYEMNVSNSSVDVLLSSVDPRRYNFPDDYVVNSSRIDMYWIGGAEYEDIIMQATKFYETIGSKIEVTTALTKKDYQFISLYKTGAEKKATG